MLTETQREREARQKIWWERASYAWSHQDIQAWRALLLETCIVPPHLSYLQCLTETVFAFLVERPRLEETCAPPLLRTVTPLLCTEARALCPSKREENEQIWCQGWQALHEIWSPFQEALFAPYLRDTRLWEEERTSYHGSLFNCHILLSAWATFSSHHDPLKARTALPGWLLHQQAVFGITSVSPVSPESWRATGHRAGLDTYVWDTRFSSCGELALPFIWSTLHTLLAPAHLKDVMTHSDLAWCRPRMHWAGATPARNPAFSAQEEGRGVLSRLMRAELQGMLPLGTLCTLFDVPPPPGQWIVESAALTHLSPPTRLFTSLSEKDRKATFLLEGLGREGHLLPMMDAWSDTATLRAGTRATSAQTALVHVMSTCPEDEVFISLTQALDTLPPPEQHAALTRWIPFALLYRSPIEADRWQKLLTTYWPAWHEAVRQTPPALSRFLPEDTSEFLLWELMPKEVFLATPGDWPTLCAIAFLNNPEWMKTDLVEHIIQASTPPSACSTSPQHCYQAWWDRVLHIWLRNLTYAEMAHVPPGTRRTPSVKDTDPLTCLALFMIKKGVSLSNTPHTALLKYDQAFFEEKLDENSALKEKMLARLRPFFEKDVLTHALKEKSAPPEPEHVLPSRPPSKRRKRA